MERMKRASRSAAPSPAAMPDDGEPGGFAEDHAEHLAGLGAERHADADLAGAAGYVVGHEAVDADAGEDEGEDAEGSGECRKQCLL